MWLLILGFLVHVLPGAFALSRAKQEFDLQGRLSSATFLATVVAYIGHAGVSIVAAWKSAWPIPISQTAGMVIGSSIGLAGAALYLAGRLQFGSSRLTWGLDTSRLVTVGIYCFTRNPQVAGSVLFLAGVGLIGRSGVTLLLAALVGLTSLIWLPIEEGILERKFGRDYVRYREFVPRFVGRSRDVPHDDDGAA